MSSSGGSGQEAVPTVPIRLWASARAAVGASDVAVAVPAAGVGALVTVAQALQALVERYPQVAKVVEISTVVMDGRVVTDEDAVTDHPLEILPPFAGG